MCVLTKDTRGLELASSIDLEVPLRGHWTEMQTHKKKQKILTIVNNTDTFIQIKVIIRKSYK